MAITTNGTIATTYMKMKPSPIHSEESSLTPFAPLSGRVLWKRRENLNAHGSTNQREKRGTSNKTTGLACPGVEL